MTITDLLERWEQDAARMEDYADARGATLCRRFAAELIEAVRAEQDESLGLAQAALESGYSQDHLRHEVAAGTIPNAGKKGSPRIRRADLPIKTNGRRKVRSSPEEAAAAILSQR